MQTHTFITETAQQAVEQIRAELGPSAVVLSVRRLPRNGLSRLIKHEQIEVIATTQAAAPEEPLDSVQELRNEMRLLKQQVAALRLPHTGPVLPPDNTSSS